jgi:hypothetical protein
MNDWQTAVGLVNVEAWANTDITSDAFVFAGIADKSRVLNWSPAGLADTGTDLTVPLGIAAAFLVTGVALATARRRTRS